MNKIKMSSQVALAIAVVLGILITFFITVLLFNVTDYGITIASFGASIFMILSNKSVSLKKIFGSYIVAFLVGYISSKISTGNLGVAIAAVASVIVMTLLEFQHFPALGLATAMVFNKFSFAIDLVILICIFLILAMTAIIKAIIKDPEKLRKIHFIHIEEEKIRWNMKKRELPEYLRIS